MQKQQLRLHSKPHRHKTPSHPNLKKSSKHTTRHKNITSTINVRSTSTFTSTQAQHQISKSKSTSQNTHHVNPHTPPNHKNDQKKVPLPPKPSKLLKEKETFANELRRLQIDWMQHRVRRPFYSGMTSNGLNYIDTRPSDDKNANTVIAEHNYTPSDDNPITTPLPHHTKIPETPLKLSIDNDSSKPTHSDIQNNQTLHDNDPNSKTKTSSSSPSDPISKQGITVLMVHGFSFGYGMWSENFDAMSSLPGVNRVVAFDWRGMGGSLRHHDNGPLRSSMSLLEEYKHDTFVSSPEEALMKENNEKTKHLKRTKCKQHFKQWFGSPQHQSSSSNTNTNTNTDTTNATNQQSSNHVANTHNNKLINSNDNLLPHSPTISKQKQKLHNLIREYVYNNDTSYTPQKSIDYFIDPLLQLFNELKLTDQPVIIVAHSLGGYLSTNFVHKYPGLAHSLVLASPVGVCESYGLKHDYEFESFQQFAVSAIKREEFNSDHSTTTTTKTQSTQSEQSTQKHSTLSNNTISNLQQNTQHSHTNSYFPLPTLPSFIQDPSVKDNSDNDATTLGVSNKRLTRPLILRNPIIQLIHFLWQTNNTPQSLLRGLPTRFSYAVSTSLASRMHPPGTLSEKDEKLLINYLHHIFTAPPSGEHALNSILHIDYPSFRARSEWKQYKRLLRSAQMQLVKEGAAGKPETTSLLAETVTNETSTTTSDSTSSDDTDDSDSEDFSTSPSNQKDSAKENNNTKSKKAMKNLILPSVFARKPLSDILYDVNIPTHFLFGSHDWLLHRDVPYIIGSLHEHFKHPQTIDFLHDKSLHTALSPVTLGDVPSDASDIKDAQLTSNEEKKTKTTSQQFGLNVPPSQRNQVIDNLNLHPGVTLTVLPQSGHHLYVNNVNAFNLSVHNSIIDFTQKSLLPNKQKYNHEYDNTYSSVALEKYVAEYNQHLKIENDKKLQRDLNKCYGVNRTRFKQSFDTLTKHIDYLFGSTDSNNSNIIRYQDNDESQLQASLHVQPSQVLTSKCPIQRLHRFRPLKPSKENIVSDNNNPTQDAQTIESLQQQQQSPLQHAATSSLLSQETTIPQGNLKNNMCKYAKFIYFGKNYSYGGVNNNHFDRFHQVAKSLIPKTKNILSSAGSPSSNNAPEPSQDYMTVVDSKTTNLLQKNNSSSINQPSASNKSNQILM